MGSGHVFDMINRIKQNKAIAKRHKFREHNREFMYTDQEKVSYDFKEVSQKELIELKKLIVIKHKRAQLKSLILFMVIILIVGFLVYLLFSHEV
ncbi:hypothetical protein ACG2LH_16120 [Zhouia sp. PK063]|uniref:hypothetical protein n=1 Tax=Zhouia sp. PK063 TaxID=3373602 RepID=UPI0037A6507B